MQSTGSSQQSPTRRDRPRSSPSSSEDNASPRDSEDGGAEICYDDLFGSPALSDDTDEEAPCPFEGLYTPENPPDPPRLPFTAFPPQRALYRKAFEAAYKYPDALMLVMEGVRKGLKRGKEAAEKAGGGSSC